MLDLSDTAAIKKIDPQDTLASTELIVKQLEAAWTEVNALHFDKEIRGVKNIVFCGMGASIYGALVLKALQGPEMPYPVEIISDYHLPSWVDSNTLVVLTSYSGTTEEVLSSAQEAKAKSSHMLVLTKGGALAAFAYENHLPAYIFDAKLNPAGVPRLGNGYTILGLIGLLNKLNIITVEEHEITNAIIRLKEKFAEIRPRAMADSEKYLDIIPVVFAAEHLAGNGQILRNQFNETSKTFSSYFLLPDLNHHLMEGLQFPKDAKLKFLILNSPNYSAKIKQRMSLTVDVVKQNHRDIEEFMTSGQTVYDDFLEALTYGSFLTLYLALRYDQNPAINPWVDYFKEKLK
ncbi:MAG: SIS domain-containing protein [Candidatus Levybacteria bacterium]|nr:SIS domain-containing protein [Candidatus Levybacteria bacterium]